MNRLNIITLGVKDLTKSLAFYKGLGFATKREVDEALDIVFFSNDGTKLALYPFDALAIDISLSDPPKKSSGFSGITLAINCQAKEEVDQVMAKVESLGGKIIKAPDKVFWGGYSGYFTDLDGYIFEVAYSESFKFDKQNMLILD